MSDVKIVSVWGVEPNVGSRTIAQNLAAAVADQHRVLFIDLDIATNAFYHSTHWTHTTKNVQSLVQRIQTQQDRNILQQYTMNSESYQLELKKNANAKTILQALKEVPENLDFLTLSETFRASTWPRFDRTEDLNQFTTELMDEIRAVKGQYDLILLNVPANLQVVTSLPVITRSEGLIAVLNNKKSTLLNYKERMKAIKQSPEANHLAFYPVINMATDEFTLDDYQQWSHLSTLETTVPYFPEVAMMDFSGRFSVPEVREYLRPLMKDLGFETPQTARKGMLGRR